MSNPCCFFVGHREASNEILPMLTSIIEQHILEYGVTEFIVGSYGGFDCLATAAVIAAKQKYPSITLSLLLPYHPYEHPVQIPKGVDDTYYPPGMESVPKRYAIIRANRYMIAHVDYLIAYVWYSASNASKLVRYAQSRQAKGLLHITHLQDL